MEAPAWWQIGQVADGCTAPQASWKTNTGGSSSGFPSPTRWFADSGLGAATHFGAAWRTRRSERGWCVVSGISGDDRYAPEGTHHVLEEARSSRWLARP